MADIQFLCETATKIITNTFPPIDGSFVDSHLQPSKRAQGTQPPLTQFQETGTRGADQPVLPWTQERSPLQIVGTSVPQLSGVSAEDGCPWSVCCQSTAPPAGSRPPGLCHRRGCPRSHRTRAPCPTHPGWRPRAAAAPGSGPADPLRTPARSRRMGSAGAPAPAGSGPTDAGPDGCHRSPGLPFASRPCRPGRVESRSRQGRPECRSLSDPCGAGPGRTAGSHGNRSARPGPAGLRVVCARREGLNGSARRGGRG